MTGTSTQPGQDRFKLSAGEDQAKLTGKDSFGCRADVLWTAREVISAKGPCQFRIPSQATSPADRTAA